jgi:type IV pilus biogenesis protein CpaD/CtpE
MAMFCKRMMLLSFTALPLASCATVDPSSGSVDRYFGEATAWNKAAQIINPDPVYVENGAQPGNNGEVAANATERYRTDKVKPLERVGTTALPAQGSGSNSGGGSGPN